MATSLQWADIARAPRRAAEQLPLPRELYIESTSRCNEHCDQCPRTHLGREADRDISLAEVRSILDQLPQLERVVLHGLGEQGRTILFSSHILEEVERLSGTIQVMVAGRLAASGDFRAIRRLMTSRPHVFLVRTSDDRGLGATLIGRPAVTGVEVTDHGLSVRASDYGTFSREIAALSRDRGIRLRELLPEDESLESVFAYLIDTDGPRAR